MTTRERKQMTDEAFRYYRESARHEGGTRIALLRKALRRFEDLGLASMVTCIERLLG